MLCGLVNTCCVLNHHHSISHLQAPIMSQNQSPNFCTSHQITDQCPFTFPLVTPKALLLACHPSHPYLYNITATQKFLKFLCHSLTTYRNFYSPPSPSKLSPLAMIQQFQRGFHDRKHFWKSYCVSFFTFCDMVWISLMLPKRRPLSFNFIFRNRKKSQGERSGN